MVGPEANPGDFHGGKVTDTIEVWKARFDAKFAQLGGPGGFLGNPTTELAAIPDSGGGWMQSFEHGALCAARETAQVFEVHGAIYDKWVEVGGPGYGWPISDESAGPGTGRLNHFTNSKEIYWSPETGAHVVYGGIRAKWFQLGDAGGGLGYPTTDEMDNPDNDRSNRADRCQRFQGGFISWNVASGAHPHNNGTPSTLTVAHLNIHSIRSRHRDTNVINMSAIVPGQPDVNVHEGLGDFGVGDYDINKRVQFVADDPTARLNILWVIANNEAGDTKELNDKLKGTLKEAADKGGAALGALVGSVIGSGAPVVGTVVGAAMGYLLGLGLQDFFANCDGLVASDAVIQSAASWNDQVAEGPVIVKKIYPGSPSEHGCGDDSNYEVTWTAT